MPAAVAPPKIITARLVLEPLRQTDIQDVYAYASNPKICKFVGWEAHKDLQDSTIFLNWAKERESTEDGKIFYVLAIRLKENGRVIGCIDFKNVTPWIGQLDYALGVDYWNLGLMTEAANAVKDWALDTFPNIVRLQAGCIPENHGSSRVMEKIGMTFEGIRRKCIVHRGRPIDLAYYVLIR